MDNQRNFFITIALSVVILTLWQVFYMNPRIEAQRHAAQIDAQHHQATKKTAAANNTSASSSSASNGSTTPASPSGSTAIPGQTEESAAKPAKTRAEDLAASKRIKIDTPSLSGSINLTGARLDDLVLKNYKETVQKNSPNIDLLNPQGMPNGYYAEVGFLGSKETGNVPGPDTVWSVKGNPVLTPKSPVTLTYTNEKGLTFNRTISVDDKYMFTVKDTVTNASGAPVTLSNYGRITRLYKPKDQSSFYLHEGLIGMTGKEGLEEIKYSKIEKEKEVTPGKSTDGWLGFTDKYWAVALIPSGKQPFQPQFGYYDNGGHPRYQSDYLTNQITVAPGKSDTLTTRIFAGAKEVSTLNAYEKDLHIRRFDLLIDWGYFWLVTKPMFWLIDTLFKFFGNFGLAIIGTTVILKLLFFPLANKSYASMAKMKKVQPAMTEIREKYADDKMKQQQAMMQLYKTEKINPIAGCWPMLLQVPVFFALYKVLYITIEMRHAPFFGWIHDLAAPDPTSIFNLFGLLPFMPPAFLPHLGVWTIILGVTMFLQMRMNPTPPDPTQQMIFNWMPVVFTIMMANFPAGLVIYYCWNNTLSVLQQSVIMKRQGMKIALWDNLSGMFRRKGPKPAE